MNNAFVTDLKSNTRSTVIELLNARLADVIDLKLTIKQAHWNMRGSTFIALHELFDQIAARLEEHADVIAERVVQLGGLAAGTTQQVANATSLQNYPAETTSQSETIKAIGDRLSSFAASGRSAIDEADAAGDTVTADIMTEVTRAVDKDHWFVAAHLD